MRVEFHYRKELEALRDGIEERSTAEGAVKVSSAALTAFDLLRYPHASGGIGNVVAVLRGLGERIGPRRLASLSAAMKQPVVQRLGYLLDALGAAALTAPMHAALAARGPWRWVELDLAEAQDPQSAPEPLERNERWRVIARRRPEPGR